MNIENVQYKEWLYDLKHKIRSAQIKASIAVNTALIEFYWELGKMISEKEHIWGNKLIEQVAKDLKKEFPSMKGLSRSNLFYCRQFYSFYNDNAVQQVVGQFEKDSESLKKAKKSTSEIIQQPVGQFLQQLVAKVPWGHNIIIFSKSKDVTEASFYIRQTISNNWSRDTLALQIKTNLYERSGKAITNFDRTLPQPQSDLAQQTLKDPYVFDFMTFSQSAKERDIENQLTDHIVRFLLELGKGFAFIGRQQHIEVAGNDYYLDLLFYHTKLKCYVVIELKNKKFIPEYAGKLNFYLSAVDELIKQNDDKPTIGIMLCREKIILKLNLLYVT
ncbi:PDDEXK nuclease domain-containing protein [Niabella ginsengisoli]|uniref:PDDEXK nuclease domain-containing protein n=1 Tax=Niabella ginsengisoli TaxID=522298 RepID=A0ABS9SPM9_9BACT|nr:PDDEXK nuclease domain-containing protein [Niabella ginsengisoli]MCH5600368.1 PDDEXK nuclease domain-containing protein [Niabella ginsengisoli]